MEKTISELIQRYRPLTGTSSLSSFRTISPSKPQSPEPPRVPTTSQNPNPKILKTLNHPTVLTGTLTLPSHSTTRVPKCSCFCFSDGSSNPICCDILDFNPQILGKKIKITAWNFIPLKCGNGFLEIVSWELLESCSITNTFPLVSGYTVDHKECKDSSKAKYFRYGALDSISPILIVTNDSRNLTGFLVNMLICECNMCGLKDLKSSLHDLNEEKGSNHSFIKPMIIYFHGYDSCWHPVITRLVGKVVLLSGLTKKLVFVKKEDSKLMYLTTNRSSLHLPKLVKTWILPKKVEIKGKGECACYSGIVTGSYMQGMVIELDREVMLLLTDKQLAIPHSLRVGSIVSIRNVHFVNSRFSSIKVLILGACLRTSINVESFSPLETRCHMVSHSQSLIGKFVNSLAFGARLWILLLTASFTKMFSGIFSDKDIVGTKHMEGLVQKYAKSYLSQSLFKSQHGVLTDFLKHDSCTGGIGTRCSHLKLVLPISTLISQCKSTWIKTLLDPDIDNMGPTNYPCGGVSFLQPIKRGLSSEQMGCILLGLLKMSSSGRFQLVDSTGAIDVFVSDLPLNSNSSRIYEIKDFNIYMEGKIGNLDELKSLTFESITCKSIFNSPGLVKEMDMSLYLHYNVKDEETKNCLCPFCIDSKDSYEKLENGTYHLMRLMHKFPIPEMLQGVISNKSSVFAEAIILPWDLTLPDKDREIHHNSIDFLDHNTRHEHGESPLKRCRIDRSLNLPCEIQCKITGKGVNYCSMGVLKFTEAEVKKIGSHCTSHAKKVLLEFSSESLYLYQALKIGNYYIVKHEKNDISCNIKDQKEIIGNKVVITSEMHFWSASLSCDNDVSDDDINLCMPANVINYIKFDSETHNVGPTLKSSHLGSHLPSGELISLHGLVMSVHGFNQGTSSRCIHIMTDNHQIKIVGPLNKGAYPTGFGQGVHASFHRILEIDRQKEYKMIPASCIEIDSKSPIIEQSSAYSNKVGPIAGPTVLISELSQAMELKSIHLHCRVLAVYVVIFEETRRVSSSFIDIALAGFMLDDGTSSCYCWANHERAAALLRLHVQTCTNSKTLKLSKQNLVKKTCSDGSNMDRLKGIIKKHGKIIVKNYGSAFDSSFHNLTFCVNSGKSFGTLDEDFLRCLILNACFSTILSVVGSVMDLNGTKRLKKQLADIQMTMLPLQSIWATGIHHIDPLNEARNIFQQLVKR